MAKISDLCCFAAYFLVVIILLTLFLRVPTKEKPENIIQPTIQQENKKPSLSTSSLTYHEAYLLRGLVDSYPEELLPIWRRAAEDKKITQEEKQEIYNCYDKIHATKEAELLEELFSK